MEGNLLCTLEKEWSMHSSCNPVLDCEERKGRNVLSNMEGWLITVKARMLGGWSRWNLGDTWSLYHPTRNG